MHHPLSTHSLTALRQCSRLRLTRQHPLFQIRSKFVQAPSLAQPTPEYLAGVCLPKPPDDHAATARKLLVVDLGGTLVLRGPEKPIERPPNSKKKVTKHRVSYLRPFLRTFTAYLFHPETRVWLDTVVWSNAKETSVNDMVQAAFGDHSYDLLKKYDGDMMNFTREGHMEDPKSPTIKNLREVWKRLLRLPKHDLYTTFIMDDYTWEHVRQPWNHFNVPRYTRQLRDRDLYIDKYYQSENVEKLDDALICAIGILDTLKLQKNVAYWIKEGGLLLNHKPSMDAAMLHRKYWWGIPEIRKYWREVGLEVIKEMRLPISPGVRQDVSFDPYRWKG